MSVGEAARNVWTHWSRSRTCSGGEKTLGGGRDGESCRNDCLLESPGLNSPASSSPRATTTPPDDRGGSLPMRGDAEEGTGLRLTAGSFLGAVTCWWDEGGGGLDVEEG